VLLFFHSVGTLNLYALFERMVFTLKHVNCVLCIIVSKLFVTYSSQCKILHENPITVTFFLKFKGKFSS
jgi:hypothetical protein